jgi:DNA repair exonuclease SbcCD ATPase subunit
VSGELEQVKARVIALEMENHELDCVLQRKRDLKAELTSQLEQCELEVQDMEGVLCKLQDSCERKQEDIKGLQEQLQANQYVQTLVTLREFIKSK